MHFPIIKRRDKSLLSLVCMFPFMIHGALATQVVSDVLVVEREEDGSEATEEPPARDSASRGSGLHGRKLTLREGLVSTDKESSTALGKGVSPNAPFTSLASEVMRDAWPGNATPTIRNSYLGFYLPHGSCVTTLRHTALQW
jgi:hypothetical protein